MKRIVVMISGSGSNLQTLIEQIHLTDVDAEIVGVIANKPDAYGLVRAQENKIATHTISHKDYDSRDDYDLALIKQIDRFEPDLVVLAGFMRILTANFVQHFSGKLLNIHPSLLPKHKGLQTHQRALDEGDAEHGATVHFVTEELDGGPLILQGRIKIASDDDASSLAAQVQQLEYRLFPLVTRWYAAGRLHLDEDRACLDGSPITASGLRLEDLESGI